MVELDHNQGPTSGHLHVKGPAPIPCTPNVSLGPIGLTLCRAFGEVAEICPPLQSLRGRRWNWISGQPTQCMAHSHPGNRDMGKPHPLTGQIGNPDSSDGVVLTGVVDQEAAMLKPGALWNLSFWQISPHPPRFRAVLLYSQHSKLLRVPGCFSLIETSGCCCGACCYKHFANLHKYVTLWNFLKDLIHIAGTGLSWKAR